MHENEIELELTALSGEFGAYAFPPGMIDVERLLAEEYGILFAREANDHGWLNTCCPIHVETHPSFGINQETGSYKCFSCGEGTLNDLVQQLSPDLEDGGVLELIGRYARDGEECRVISAKATLASELLSLAWRLAHWMRARLDAGLAIADAHSSMARFDRLSVENPHAALVYGEQLLGSQV